MASRFLVLVSYLIFLLVSPSIGWGIDCLKLFSDKPTRWSTEAHPPSLKDTTFVAETPRLIIARLGNKVIEPGNIWSASGKYFVFNKVTQFPIGQINVRFRSGLRELAHLPIYFDPYFHRQGFGTEAKFAVIDWVFNNFPVEGIIAVISDSNIQSINLHRKLGFELEGPGEVINSGKYILSKDRFLELKMNHTDLLEFARNRSIH